jgi:membrane fusion protein (multidrug efflux system)
MKKTIRWVSLTLIVAVGAAFAYFQFYAKNEAEKLAAESNAPRQQKRDPLSVRAMQISTKPIVDPINIRGTLMASELVDLSFESSGRITELNINEGQRVVKGTLLAKINDSELQAQRDKVNVQLKLAEDREERQRTLLEREAISRESYEQVLAEMQGLKADLAQIEAKIEKSSIVAPFDGIVGLRYTSEGAYVSPGTLVTQLVSVKPLKVDFAIPERYASIVRTGMPVTFHVNGFTRSFAAKVYAIEPHVDVKTRTLTVRAMYDNTREDLMPGRSISAVLQIQLFNNAIAIPSEALVPTMEGNLVYLFRSGKAEPISVKTGIRTESEIQITEGLSPGDTLITSGILQMRKGLPVQLVQLVK